jgi:putative transposase
MGAPTLAAADQDIAGRAAVAHAGIANSPKVRRRSEGTALCIVYTDRLVLKVTCRKILGPVEIGKDGSCRGGGSHGEARFTEEQMVRILREADQGKVAAVAKKHGVSEQTIYLWRNRFGQLDTTDVRRLRTLEAENARLKKIVAERDLEIEVMKEVAAKKW